MSDTQNILCRNSLCNSIVGTHSAKASPGTDAFDNVNKDIRGTELCTACEKQEKIEKEKKDKKAKKNTVKVVGTGGREGWGGGGEECQR